jgi:hypothetical protein
LTAYVARHPGWSGSSLANRFVDEALRMEEHPGVVFRGGASGRRAVLVGGPDVRAIVRAVKSVREAESDLIPGAVLALVATNTGVSVRLIETAVRYWSAHPDEIDSWIADIETVELEHYTAWARQEELLAQ